MSQRKEKSEKKGMRWLLLIVVNVIIVTFIVILCFVYTQRENDHNKEVKKTAFSAMVSATITEAYRYMKAQQAICDSWARYINSNRFTEEEVFQYLKNTVNHRENFMAHFIAADTLKGRSTIPDSNGSYNVDYSGRKVLLDVFSRLPEEMDLSIYVTQMYVNPVNGENSVGFARKIWLYENGERKQYYVIRVMLESALQDIWSFPSEYERAELALIESNGDYIIHSRSLKAPNFWNYIRENNGYSEEEMNLLAIKMRRSNDVFQHKNSVGDDAYYYCIAADDTQQWYFVSYVPVASLQLKEYDWMLVILITIGFCILITIDGIYFYLMSKYLRISVEETKRANEAKTRFLSSMSHDIRTPMNAIMGMTTIAEKYIDDPAHVKECLDKISLASNHLLTLVNDVLDISKIESGKMSLNPVVFSLPETISNLANIVRHGIKVKDIDFDIRLHKVEHENLFADELRLNQILINIISNAVKYTNPGGKIIMDVEERLLPDDPQSIELVYSVEDNGIGMSEEFQKTMYDTFSRAKDSRIDKIQGSGLGLAITKQMVEMMDGTIFCESKLGVGTKFVITVKLGIAEKVTDELLLPPMKLLLVDDDVVFLETAQDTLKTMNVTADTVDNGAEAVKMVEETHKNGRDYPVVIVDWKMPGMDGVETTRNIRAAVGGDVPIIVISSYDWADVEEDARAAGANGFINKPLFKSTIYYKLNEFLHFDEKTVAKKEEDVTGLAGLHLLVAEDNDFNWEIIEEMLDIYGVEAQRASNGEICVDMLSRAEAGTYDAILMDIQMPVMNGKEAAAAIRQMLDENKKNIPIVALTADAFAEDIKECMDVGMNGHVSKPINKDKLIAEMRKAGIIKESGAT